tara:strand:- start:45790 stop:46197 length:408 start_codon:yes stop_codon:yes gene_type:complete
MKTGKNIEEFTKYIMKEVDVEKPSTDFLMNVMDAVKSESKASLSIVYKPLIPKSVWVLIVILFAALSVFVLTGSTVNYYLLSQIDIPIVDKVLAFDLFKNIHFSKIFTLSFIVFFAFVIVQLFFIKNYFNKQHIV